MHISALGLRSAKSYRRYRRQPCDSNGWLLAQFGIAYVVALLLYVCVFGSYTLPTSQFAHATSAHDHYSPRAARQSAPSDKELLTGDSPDAFGFAHLNVSEDVSEQQRVLCKFRADAERTIVVHMHIPKSGGTAFALALKSECRCNKIPRPQRGYCKECPHVIPDPSMPVVTFEQNVWAAENVSFSPPYAQNCKTYYASSRWFGFPRRNRTHTFYSSNRLTTGWPCGVHVGYARLRMCCNRLQLPGIRHVVVTLFREPLARFVSEFYQAAYNRRAISSWDWCWNRVSPMPLTEFLSMPVSYPFHSRMTKLLSGSPVQTGAAGADWTIPGVREKALERALGVLRSTEDFLYGMAEELDLTLEMFQFVFKRSFAAPSHCHSHLNTTHGGCAKVELGLHDRNGKPLTLTPEQMNLFHKNNKEEKAVYELALKTFRTRIAAMRSLQSLGSDFAIDRRCRVILEDKGE